MDKQIIIDGVDVSGCGFYHSETGTECHIALAFAEEYADDNHTYFKCEQNPNCYYKQLKRKEQECETLASQLDFEVQKKECLEQECERLKEQLAEMISQAALLPKFFGLTADEITNMLNQLDQLKAENEELKDKNQRLTILGMDLNQSNEVLRKSFFATDKSRDNWREKAEKLERTLTEIKELCQKHIKAEKIVMANDILQKISECEGNNG